MGLVDALPIFSRLWRPPAEFSHWRRCERNAFEGCDSGVCRRHSFKNAVFYDGSSQHNLASTLNGLSIELSA
jgi:hypothetical protein